MSNLCGRRVSVLAAGGRSDAVSQEDLLGVLQNGLIAKLEVQLEKQRRRKSVVTSDRSSRVLQASHLLLQHVLPLLPHLLHQQGEVRYPVSSLQLLQCSVQQTEGASSSHAGAKRHKKQHVKKIQDFSQQEDWSHNKKKINYRKEIFFLLFAF